LVPPDAKQHTQTPLVECIDRTCVRLRHRPAVRRVQTMGSGGQRSRSHEAKVRGGGMAEPSFSTPFGWV